MENHSKNHAFASVLIPVYHDITGLTRSIKALEKQSYPKDSFEVIVCNNDPNHPVALPKAEVNIQLITCSKPGAYAARNAATAAAAGTIFAFTDADCEPEPEWLAQGISRLLAENGRMMVGGEVILTSPSAPTGTALYQIDIGFCQKENILNRGFSATANLFCTRDQFERVGKFDERLFSCGDREWAWRGASNGIGVCFEPAAQVNTAPRSSLRDAIRQARRVAAGRQQLRELALEHQGAVTAKRQRTALQSALWIFSLHHRSFLQKLKILFSAVMIGGAGRLERIRLRLGATPERR